MASEKKAPSNSPKDIGNVVSHYLDTQIPNDLPHSSAGTGDRQ